jgi:hypothetical protein
VIHRLAAPAIPARIACRRVIDIVFSCAANSQKQEARSKNPEARMKTCRAAFRLLASDNRQLALLASCF